MTFVIYLFFCIAESTVTTENAGTSDVSQFHPNNEIIILPWVIYLFYLLN